MVDSFKRNYLGVSNRWPGSDPNGVIKLIEFRTKFLNSLDHIIRTNDGREVYTCDLFYDSVKLFNQEEQNKRLEEERKATLKRQIQQIEKEMRIQQIQNEYDDLLTEFNELSKALKRRNENDKPPHILLDYIGDVEAKMEKLQLELKNIQK